MKNKFKRFLSNFELLFGILMILAFAIVAIAAPRIAPPTEGESPYHIPRDGYKGIPFPPNEVHPLGTLPRQYDVFYGLIWGTRMAFLVGISITLGRTLIGSLLGLTGGYIGGLLDAIIMRITDTFMAIPAVAAAAILYAMFGEIGQPMKPSQILLSSKNEQIIIIALVAFGWMQYARLLRANVLSEREREYVQAAIAIGTPRRRILFKHLLPNSIRGLLVLIASDIGAMVATVSVFYFIGLIGESPHGFLADWGLMLSASRDWIVSASSRPFEFWYTYLPASAAIVLFTVGWSMIGDGLRDVLDPRAR
jgi:peptide/nickel transport system permease protein